MLNKLIKNNKEEILTVSPNINIYTEQDRIVVAVEMPGADKDTLDVNLEGNYLHIRGRKKKEEVGKEYKEIHREREIVEYERDFELNTEVDREKLEANYENGVLKVSLAKAESAKPKKIEIKL